MTNVCDVAVNVLGFQEDEEWCALALEMDLRGYGRTFEEALEDLHEAMTMQITFALHKNQIDMIFHPAEPRYFSLFAQSLFAQLQHDHHVTAPAGNSPTATSEYAVAGMPIPPANVIAARKADFCAA